MMSVGLAADHGGFELKQSLARSLREHGYEVVDFGAETFAPEDDYPDLVLPLARAVARGLVSRGIAISGSGVGVCAVMNKVPGVRAALCCDHCAVRQGVEEDDINVLCLGARVVGRSVAWDLVRTFLDSSFIETTAHRRRLAKIAEAEKAPLPALAERPGHLHRSAAPEQ